MTHLPQTPAPIALAPGHGTAEHAKLGAYFQQILHAETGGEDFPVFLDHVYRIAYSRKDSAVRELKKRFTQGIDFQVLLSDAENPLGGRPAEIYRLSVACVEYLVVRANAAVFEVYRQCRRAIQQQVQQRSAIPANFAESLRQLANEVEARELAEQQLQLQLQATNQARYELHEAREVVEAQQPAVELVAAVFEAGDLLDLETVAKTLALPGLGRNNLTKRLVQDKVLIRDTKLPYQSYVDQRYFQLRHTTYVDPAGKIHTKAQTMVTMRGLDFLRRKLAK